MGCMSSKSVDTAVAAGEPYLPSPTSVALFDINTIEEPWLMIKAKTLDIEDHEKQEQKDDEILKPTKHITLPLLEKLENNYDNNIAPQYSWSDVSKALQDLKPSLEQQKTQPPTSKIKKQNQEPAAAAPPTVVRPVELSGIRAVKENSFIIQDRLQHLNPNPKFLNPQNSMAFTTKSLCAPLMAVVAFISLAGVALAQAPAPSPTSAATAAASPVAAFAIVFASAAILIGSLRH